MKYKMHASVSQFPPFLLTRKLAKPKLNNNSVQFMGFCGEYTLDVVKNLKPNSDKIDGTPKMSSCSKMCFTDPPQSSINHYYPYLRYTAFELIYSILCVVWKNSLVGT